VRIAPPRRAGLASEPEVLDRVNHVLGPVVVIDDLSVRPQVCRVVKVETRSGEKSFVKWYREAPDYQREYDALTLYTPALGSDAPRLIDNDDGLRMVLISEVHGELATAGGWEWDPLVHYRAAVLLRRLHESAKPVVSDQFSRQCASRFEAAAGGLEQVVGSSAVREARVIIAQAMDIPRVSMVPAHRDNHPRNWMIDPGGHVRLIDFGLTEYDPWIVDVFALEQDYWSSDPSLRLAFLGGYDRDIRQEDVALLRAHHAVQAALGLAHAQSPGATKIEKLRAKEMFDRLLGLTLF